MEDPVTVHHEFPHNTFLYIPNLKKLWMILLYANKAVNGKLPVLQISQTKKQLESGVYNPSNHLCFAYNTAVLIQAIWQD
jgi:hypothetical protein